MKRVLIVRSNHLLTSAVERLLTCEKDFVVRSVSMEMMGDLYEEVTYFRPHVVIIGQWDLRQDPLQIFNIVNNFPRIRFIVIDSEDNILHIYCKRQVEISQGNDLISAVRSS